MLKVLRILLILLRLAVDYALPPRCPGCGFITPADHLFCVTCWQRLDFLGGPACASCGEPFAIDPGPGGRCGTCLADPPPIDGMAAAVAYGEIARTLAMRLKYGGKPGVAVTLARQMKRLVPTDQPVLLVPVPLHRWRLWRRGFNQALLIARALGRETGMPVAPDLLQRVKPTPLLRGLGPTERRRTVKGAFRVDPAKRDRIRGVRIILVDDVYTTGATVGACARALKRAGAAEIRVCCWARVIRDIDNAALR